MPGLEIFTDYLVKHGEGERIILLGAINLDYGRLNILHISDCIFYIFWV